MDAQTLTTITGSVKDGMGEPLVGASVVQKGTSNGTITDLDGNFKLQVPAGVTLVFAILFRRNRTESHNQHGGDTEKQC